MFRTYCIERSSRCCHYEDAWSWWSGWMEVDIYSVSHFVLFRCVSLGWNLTSLYINPTSLTFSAYCSSNKNTYPIGPTSVPGTATELLWVPYDYQTGPGAQTPLVQGTYTLQVQDEFGTTELGKSGMFNYNNAITFAIYTTQPYTPLARKSNRSSYSFTGVLVWCPVTNLPSYTLEWTCPACSSSAITGKPHPAMYGVIVTLIVMVVSGWGLLRSMVNHNRDRS